MRAMALPCRLADQFNIPSGIPELPVLAPAADEEKQDERIRNLEAPDPKKRRGFSGGNGSAARCARDQLEQG